MTIIYFTVLDVEMPSRQAVGNLIQITDASGVVGQHLQAVGTTSGEKNEKT
jgi:hypothetical protein